MEVPPEKWIVMEVLREGKWIVTEVLPQEKWIVVVSDSDESSSQGAYKRLPLQCPKDPPAECRTVAAAIEHCAVQDY